MSAARRVRSSPSLFCDQRERIGESSVPLLWDAGALDVCDSPSAATRADVCDAPSATTRADASVDAGIAAFATGASSLARFCDAVGYSCDAFTTPAVRSTRAATDASPPAGVELFDASGVTSPVAAKRKRDYVLERSSHTPRTVRFLGVATEPVLIGCRHPPNGRRRVEQLTWCCSRVV